MLANQMLVALFLGVGNLGVPSPFLHYPFGLENSVLKMVMNIDTVLIHDQVGILDVSPPITVTDTWNIPGSVAYGTGYELAELYGSWHDGSPLCLDMNNASSSDLISRPECWANGLFG
jgi:hypothetical protein